MSPSLLTAHILVRNEEQWVWYAIRSVLPYVSKVVVFDTGSTDLTATIIRSISSKRIDFQERGPQDRQGLVRLRNEMLTLTKTGWFLLVDGDEIWPRRAIRKLVNAAAAANQGIWGIVVRTRNCVGDIQHFQPESAGKYRLLGRTGHFSIRAYRKLPGFSWKGEYPWEAFCDNQGTPINDQDRHLRFLDVAYWHVTHLRRSSRSDEVLDRQKKRKRELGIAASRSELPEVFFRDRPKIVPPPVWQATPTDQLLSTVTTPLRKIKRRLVR